MWAVEESGCALHCRTAGEGCPISLGPGHYPWGQRTLSSLGDSREAVCDPSTHTQSTRCPSWSLPSPEFPCNVLVLSCRRTCLLLWGLSEVEEKMGWRQSLQGADVPMARTIYLNEPLRNTFCKNSIRWEDCGGRRRGRRKEAAVVFPAINNTLCGCLRLEQCSWTCRNSLQRLLEVALCSDLSSFAGTHPPAECSSKTTC